jgi:hypothetical protein
MSCQRQLAWRSLNIQERAALWKKEARLQSELEVKEEEAVLMLYVLELLGQFLVFFFQGEEAPANFQQAPNNRLKKAQQEINPQVIVRRASLSVNT